MHDSQEILGYRDGGIPIRAPQILGYRASGAPIWEIMGSGPENDDQDDDGGDQGDGGKDDDADTDGDADEGDDSDAEDADDDEGDKPLGPKGEKALAALKERRRKAAERARKAEKERDEARAELDKLRNGGKDDDADKDKPDPTAKANERILKSEIKAAAKGVLADPSDAYLYLDLSSFDVDDDGEVDEDEIADAIKDLVEKRPYLAAQGGKRFQGSNDGGPRNAARKSQLKEADLDRMTPQQIEKARVEGRLDRLMGKNR